MWVILLSLFVLSKDTAGEIDCDVPPFHSCQRPKLLEGIPREVEVFNALCPEVPPYLQCVRDYFTECDSDINRWVLDTYTSIKPFFDELCEEGSNLNEILTNNLKCFNETLINTNCEEERRAFIDPYEKEVPLDEDTTTHTIPERVHCLSQILFAECLVSDITRACGLRSRHLSLEFLSKSSFVDGSCPLSYRETLLEDIDEFKLTEQQKTFAIAELERMKINNVL